MTDDAPMTDDASLERRVARLEERLAAMEREHADALTSEVRRRRRASWMRIAALVIVFLAYLVYFHELTRLF